MNDINKMTIETTKSRVKKEPAMRPVAKNNKYLNAGSFCIFLVFLLVLLITNIVKFPVNNILILIVIRCKQVF